MLSQTEICRQHAAECKRRAALTDHENVRELYCELARQWGTMIEDIKRLDAISDQANL
jgi:hypothetical protein